MVCCKVGPVHHGGPATKWARSNPSGKVEVASENLSTGGREWPAMVFCSSSRKDGEATQWSRRRTGWAGPVKSKTRPLQGKNHCIQGKQHKYLASPKDGRTSRWRWPCHAKCPSATCGTAPPAGLIGCAVVGEWLMLSRLQSAAHQADMNWATPKQAVQLANRALAQSAEVMEERGIASGHLAILQSL
jgi:hypothetical protein